MAKIKKSGDDSVLSVQFPVVGIGASAGGLDAVRQFLQIIPEKSGMAYVFVQHLSPTHESSLSDILERTSSIKVQQIKTDITNIQPDHFYIVPANKIVTVSDGLLKLSPLSDKHNKLKVIDLFFSSLATAYQSYAVGIVLSGMLTDGSSGLQAIKSSGGITFAQDEDSAAFKDMPKNAVNSGAVDFILSPSAIATHLMAINLPFNANYSETEIENTVPEQDEETFRQLLAILRARRGVDFSYYKPSTLKRRIVRRMALNNIKKPLDYLSYLRENKIEQDALYNDMLISVTNFFRDQESFDLLCTSVFPALIRKKNTNEPLRIWIAGCATGEEAYSMAICLQEQLGDKAAAIKIQIFATDISETAIAKARTGIYRPTDLQGLSTSRIAQFFTKQDGSYHVNKQIRDMCVFAQHNLLKDPPFSNIDIVSCRNVLIYMEPVLQKRAITTFHYSLNEQGFLMLGKSENIGNNPDIFAPYHNQEKIFSRIGARGRVMQVTSQGTEQSFKNIDKNISSKEVRKDIFKISDDLILSDYAPASVLVNSRFDIIQFRGSTDLWLTSSQGKASFNLLKMAREGLAFELRNLLHLTRKTNTLTKKEAIFFKFNDEQNYVDIKVVPIRAADEQHYLVFFEKGMVLPILLPSGKNSKQARNNIDPRDLRIEQQEKELMQCRADMKTITDEQEAINEELQRANQELLSGSEELQSLNEELETSKEELQSTNEEITIINNELLDRNEQLNNARRYTEGIINTIRDPLLILDKDLRVKRASDGFYNKFKVSEKETEGRYLYHLGNGQWNIPTLKDLLERVISERKEFIDFEVIHIFPSIGRVVMHLNARQLDKINGEQLILLAIEDVTAKRKVEEGLAEVEKLFAESKERLRLAVDSAGLGTWDYNPMLGEMIWDNRCKEMFGLSHNEHISYLLFINMIHPEDRNHVDADLKQALAGINNGEYEKEFRTIEKRENKHRWIKFKGKAYSNEEGVAYRFVGTSLDITIQKQLDEATTELLKQKDDFISIASHELKTPITSLKGSLQLIGRMKENPSPEKLNALIEISGKSLDKVSVLIEDLLNASRINQGQLHLNKTHWVISKVIDDCCNHVRMAGQYTLITEGDLKLEVYADANRIDQVVINFVNNAIKYAPESKQIRINIEKIGKTAKISVIDNGPGISIEKQPHLFDRFYRVDNGGMQYSGLGLGLFISAEIIKKHHGTIGVDSEAGKGSTFWFIIPLS